MKEKGKGKARQGLTMPKLNLKNILHFKLSASSAECSQKHFNYSRSSDEALTFHIAYISESLS